VQKFEIMIGGVDHRPVNRPAIYRSEILVFNLQKKAPQSGRFSEDWQAMKSWSKSTAGQLAGPDAHRARQSVRSLTLFAGE